MVSEHVGLGQRRGFLAEVWWVGRARQRVHGIGPSRMAELDGLPGIAFSCVSVALDKMYLQSAIMWGLDMLLPVC
jgi:hypothetical protein